MKISEILKENRVNVSFEVFPPKQWDKKGDTFFFNKYEIKNRDLLKKYENK